MNRMKNWGDEEEDEDALPQNTTTIDNKGIKTTTQYFVNDKGQKMKTVRKIRVVNKTKKISKKIHERRQLAKFGQFKDNKDHTVSIKSRDEIKIETPGEETNTNADEDNVMNAMRAVIKKRALEKLMAEKGMDVPGMTEDGKELPPLARRAQEMGLKSGLTGGSGKYQAPRSRNSKFARQDDQTNSLRVTNISEDTDEQDLQELFRPFGTIQRIYLAKDRETNISRGFAYISYIRREDAEKAMMKLNGFGYDHLILKVEWARPTTQQDVGGQNVMKHASGYGGALPQGLAPKKTQA